MPAVAVLATSALTSLGAAFGTASVLGGLSVAGTALSGVGLLTGNKTLMKVGGLIGLGTGIASLAQGLAGAGGAAGAASSGTAGATEAIAEGAKATAGQSIEAAKGLADVAKETATQAGGSTASLASAAQGPLDAFGQEAAASMAGAGAPAAGASAGGIIDKAAGFSNPLDARLAAGTAATPMAAEPSVLSKIGDTFSNITNWIEKNPGAAKLGAGLIQGAAGYYGPIQAQKEMMAQRRKYEDAIRQRYNDSVAGLTVPNPFSTPQRPSGIIAGSRG